MTLIKSISGIRGTIGGAIGDALTPLDIVKFASAYCTWLKAKYPGRKCKVVVGRDARLSGTMVRNTVCGALLSCGVDVVDAGYASTPTTEMAVILEKADGGIILTASHNPKHWNALKLLNEKGEFLTAEDGAKMLDYAAKEEFEFVDVDSLGKICEKDFTISHIEAVLKDSLVDAEAIRNAGFKVVLDAINSVGGPTMPILLEKLGVECIKLNCEP
ncbi:MAG: phosphoglucosamine mutase, partial [Bacteroidales bacterium]|nr:phosphoglucosamine mutase [Bacteroidales bacterium]